MITPLPIPKSVAPTDNLYKFAALFGLTLIVVAAVLIAFRTERYNELAVAYKIDELIARSATTPPTTQVATTFPVAIKSTSELQKEAIELAAEKALLNAQMTDCNFLLGIGGVISIIGFVAWYCRLQRHLDHLLEAQVKNELASIGKPSQGAAEKNVTAK
jgi:hypothetical protein